MVASRKTVNRIECGNIVHEYFERAKPSIEERQGQLWIEVDFTVGRDMNDCFERGEPVSIDGEKYMIEELDSKSSGMAGDFRVRKL
jgi:hypothetical protein